MQNTFQKPVAATLRLRQKLRRHGPTALSGQELLAIILGRHRSEARNLELAQNAFRNYGDTAIIQEKRVERMLDLTGLPDEACIRTIAAFELGRRYTRSIQSKPREIHCPGDVYHLLRGRMEHQTRECLYGIYLDSQNRILRQSLISIGTLDQTFMQPRDVFHPAFECNAAGIILAHNHPDGDPSPSSSDIRHTKALQQTAQTMGFELLDHIVIGRDSYRSTLLNSPLS